MITMAKNNILRVEGVSIGIKEIDSQRYISLTDIAKKKNSEEPRFVIINWLRNRNTVEFLGIWEKIHNSNFNRVGFDTVRSNAGLITSLLKKSINRERLFLEVWMHFISFWTIRRM